jgi:dihydrofolate reductase/thymidylate synthase
MKINIVVAVDKNTNGIGYKGSIPWSFPEDLRYFKELTSSAGFKNAIIMGRKTYESIGKPLPNRLNVVISSSMCLNKSNNESPCIVKTPEEAIEKCRVCGIDNAFIIGGSSIYDHFMSSNVVNEIYITWVNGPPEQKYDTFFKAVPSNFSPVENATRLLKNKETNDITGFVVKYRQNESFSEYQYLDLVERILKEGTLKPNRTEQPTLSIFNHVTKWSLQDDRIPLLTTKKIFFRGLVEELVWFISGSTDSKILESKGINIWKGNTTREFLDARGLFDYPEGDIGAGYGFQWRHSGAEYINCNTDYTNKGSDQLQDLLNELKNNPNSRRMIICSWNPSSLSKMALPPCHVLFQVYVADGFLHSSLYQRSADVGLGVPFNIASYAIFTRILAHCCSLKAGIFYHVTGDTHIYVNHVDGLKQQLGRIPREFPKLLINTENKDIFSLCYKDFEIVDYNPYDNIKLEMAV